MFPIPASITLPEPTYLRTPLFELKFVVKYKNIFRPNPNISDVLKNLKGVSEVYLRKNSKRPLEFVIVCDQNICRQSIKSRIRKAFKRKYHKKRQRTIRRNFVYPGPDLEWIVDWKIIREHINVFTIINISNNIL